jgi:uncharacterized membrane protein
MMWVWDGYGYNWNGMSMSMLIMFAALVALVAFAIWAASSFATHRSGACDGDDILRRELEEGEITQEQYELLHSQVHQEA